MSIHINKVQDNKGGLNSISEIFNDVQIIDQLYFQKQYKARLPQNQQYVESVLLQTCLEWNMIRIEREKGRKDGQLKQRRKNDRKAEGRIESQTCQIFGRTIRKPA